MLQLGDRNNDNDNDNFLPLLQSHYVLITRFLCSGSTTPIGELVCGQEICEGDQCSCFDERGRPMTHVSEPPCFFSEYLPASLVSPSFFSEYLPASLVSISLLL